MNNNAIEIAKEVKADVNQYVEAANALVITGERELIIARDSIRVGRELIAKITDWFAPLKAAAKAAHQALCDKERAELAPLEQARQILTAKISDYQLAEQRRIDEERKKAELEALKRREAIERRVQDRIDALASKCLSISDEIAELEKAIVDEATDEDERDLLRAKISALTARLENTKSKIDIETEKIEAPLDVPIAETEATRVKGIGNLKKVLIPKIVNPYALLAAVAEKKVPLSVVKFDEVKIKRLVNEGMTLPGVVTSETYKPVIR